MTRRAWVVAAVLLSGTAWSGPISVAVSTADSREIRGTVAFDKVRLKTAEGDLEIDLAKAMTITVSGDEARIALTNATTETGKLAIEEWTVDCRLGAVRVPSSMVRSIRVNPPAPTGTGLEAEAGQGPIALLRMNAAMAGRLVMSEDRATIYLLNASDATLVSVSAADLSVSATLSLPSGATCWGLSPDGQTAVAAGGKVVTGIDLAHSKVLKSFEIEHNIIDIFPLDGETVLAASESGLLVLSISRQLIVHKEPMGRAQSFLLSADRRKVYIDSAFVALPEKPPARPEDFVPVITRIPYGSNSPFMTMSPDGRLAIDRQGTLRRPGRSYVADMADCGRLEQNLSALVLPEAARILLFNNEGFVKSWDLTSMEMRVSRKIGRRVWSAVADEKRRILIAFCQPSDPQRGGGQGYERITPPGDLVVIPIPE